ncbi:MAG: conjugal transfer protein TraX [Lachnospiraceae bacterium]|nr:conjugal transfer protein TraX [Lachnospiraceae bacterium]
MNSYPGILNGKGIFLGYNGPDGHKLKVVAVLTMLIDHIGAALYYPVLSNIYFGNTALSEQIYQSMRNIGRIAFPIFAFLLVEGFLKTHDRRKYAMRLLMFAIISEIPFQLAFYSEFAFAFRNVFFTLFLGFLTIWGLERTGITSLFDEGISLWDKTVRFLLSSLLISLSMFIAFSVDCDYDYRGIMLIVIFYIFREVRLFSVVFGYLSFLFEPWALPAFVMLYFYNGERGRQHKFFYYIFYPAHLMVLYLVRFVFAGY